MLRPHLERAFGEGVHLRALFQRFRSSVRSLPTISMFAENRVLFVATLVLGAVALSPFFVTPFLPLVDLGSNVGAAMLLDDAAWGDGTVAEHYSVYQGPVPYWTGYLALAALEPILGVLVATKVVIACLVLGLPIATMRLLFALGRSPLPALWVFMLTWDKNLFWGWFTFQLGMIMALFGIAWLIEMRTWGQTLRLAVLGVFIGLTHVHSVAFAGVVGGMVTMVKRPLLSSFLQSCAAFLGFVLPLLVWFLTVTQSGNATRERQPFQGVFHDLAHRVAALHAYSLDNIPEAQWQSVSALLLFLSAPLIFSALPSRSLSSFQRLAPVAISVGIFALYFALPYEVKSPVPHFWTYPRFATYVVIAFILVPAPDFSRLRALVLAPGVVLAVLINWTIRDQFSKYGEYTRPYLDIIAGMENGSTFLPLDLNDYRYKGTAMPAIGQLHGYAAAVTSSYDGHLFDNPSNPLLFRRDKIRPHPPWWEPHKFNMRTHGRYYDYVIVHPTEKDPFMRDRRYGDKHFERVQTSGPWRLYKVKEPLELPSPSAHK